MRWEWHIITDLTAWKPPPRSVHSYLLDQTKALAHPHLWPRSVKFAFAGWLGTSVANKVEQITAIAGYEAAVLHDKGWANKSHYPVYGSAKFLFVYLTPF